MKKILALILFFIFIFSYISAEVNWIDYNKSREISKKQNKTILLYFYSTNCPYCQKMEDEIFADKSISGIINENFIPVKINLQKNETIDKGGQFETTLELARHYQVRGTPNTYFIDFENNPLTRVPGFAPPKTFKILLNYIASESYKNIEWKEYYNKRK
ncbi:MAG: thioredoxin family protein [Candidatus Mcinerneyibacterium aminivorans]|jgi:thioredoxin-related protein|uniref:Thioredoxin family protein n=1 Tax=Candidatus Mcinerneyibacterium aminivorans TaxID=2703815 RepID=A0A5D0MJ49_9BACT|nr:MAG: thioredoxin family protein [Candidatus Mcinerneyibacterium aminivorans]